ncbi:MAG: hypothetical protein C4298_06645 [Thermus sp.]
MRRLVCVSIFSLVVVVTACATPLRSPAAPRSSYPEKPITMIVPFPAGGTVDLVARALVEAEAPAAYDEGGVEA